MPEDTKRHRRFSIFVRVEAAAVVLVAIERHLQAGMRVVRGVFQFYGSFAVFPLPRSFECDGVARDFYGVVPYYFISE